MVAEVYQVPGALESALKLSMGLASFCEAWDFPLLYFTPCDI
jgi:hypothetical protein